jgi:ribosome-binding factor A
VKDPRVGFVTITHVKLSPDLQFARVYYTVMGDATARRQSARALERATPFVRRQIGARIRLRRVPELRFVFDESVEREERIERLLEEIRTTDANRNEDAESDDRG